MRRSRAVGKGRYRLEKPLGRGGAATVWRAHDLRLDVPRAVKILEPGEPGSAGDRRRFLEEARTLARIGHPNVVAVHDAGEEGGDLWIVLDLCEGGDLWAYLAARGPLSVEEAVGVGRALLGALAAAHACGVVHRDVKPQNLLLGADGRPRLADFGIARFARADVHLTRTGTTLGTWAFMAPEQRLDPHAADVRSDLYAAGATLWACLAGRSPPDLFLADRDKRLLDGIPAPLCAVIERATRYEPGERYPSAEAMARDLEAWPAASLRFAGAPGAGGEVPPTAGDARPRRGRGRLALAAAALGTGCAVAGALLALRGEPGPAPALPASGERCCDGQDDDGDGLVDGDDDECRIEGLPVHVWGAAFCGGLLWVTEESTGTALAFDPATRALAGRIEAGRAGERSFHGVACHRGELWLSAFPSGDLYRLLAGDPTPVATDLHPGPYRHGLASDGEALMLADGGDHHDNDGHCRAGERCFSVDRLAADGAIAASWPSDENPGDLEWVAGRLLVQLASGPRRLDAALLERGPRLAPGEPPTPAYAWDGACLWRAAGGIASPVPADADRDGHIWSGLGGDDCDDLDPAVHGGAPERPGGRIDADCDGVIGARLVYEDGFEDGLPGEPPTGPWTSGQRELLPGLVTDEDVAEGTFALASSGGRACLDLPPASEAVAVRVLVHLPEPRWVHPESRVQLALDAGGVDTGIGLGQACGHGAFALHLPGACQVVAAPATGGWHRLEIELRDGVLIACADDACTAREVEAGFSPERACLESGNVEDWPAFAFDAFRAAAG